jgi:protein TonB
VDPTITRPERTNLVAATNDPIKVPDNVGVVASNIPIYTKGAVLRNRNVDPPLAPSTANSCVSCPGTPTTVKLDEKPPEPVPVKPATQRVTSIVLVSKALSLPQPPYPQLAKQIRAAGPVNVQIVVDEQGKVISAQALNGHPALTGAAKEAAMRARFSPTVLNGQPVKIQGMITYNFVLQ